jgi:UDP-N-acetylmuramate--alanine ligase
MKHIITSDFKININRLQDYKFYFIGILGSGMSALAKFLKLKGADVSGSDRSYNNFQETGLSNELTQLGCPIYKQNGFHINENIDFVIVSSAIERDNLDVQKAVEYKIPVIHRTDMLSVLVNKNKSVCVAGTSGKSTTTGIIAYVLKKNQIDINMINGAGVKNILDINKHSSCVAGNSDWYIIETDESDGTIVKFYPEIGVLNNISKDHKTIDELKILFYEYLNNIRKTIVYNIDDNVINSLKLPEKKLVSFGQNKNADYVISDIILNLTNSKFKINNKLFEINLPGIYNVYNTAAAISVLFLFGLEYEAIYNKLKEFNGVDDRFDILKQNNPLIVFDYAHNPAKIGSLLEHITRFYKKNLFIYQPHGFQPTYFTKTEFYDLLKKYFGKNSGFKNKCILKPIYYAGGKVEKKITSNEIVNELKNDNVNIIYGENENFIFEYVKQNKKLYDTIIIAGARDKKLKLFSEKLLNL